MHFVKETRPAFKCKWTWFWLRKLPASKNMSISFSNIGIFLILFHRGFFSSSHVLSSDTCFLCILFLNCLILSTDGSSGGRTRSPLQHNNNKKKEKSASSCIPFENLPSLILCSHPNTPLFHVSLSSLRCSLVMEARHILTWWTTRRKQNVHPSPK